MSVAIDPQNVRAVLLGTGAFPKDDSLRPLPAAPENARRLAALLSDDKTLGLNGEHVVALTDSPGNTLIKEELLRMAESARGMFIFYYSGYVVSRKGRSYLASYDSTRKQVHVNGISFDELLALTDESDARVKVFIIDAMFLNAQGEGPAELHFTGENANAANALFLLSSSPRNTEEQFGEDGQKTHFTQALVSTLEEGLLIDRDTLTVEEVYREVAKRLEAMNVNRPLLIGEHTEGLGTYGFVKNSRFMAFLSLKEKADALFEEQKFAEALPLYKQALLIRDTDEQIKNRVLFTAHVTEANEHFEAEDFAKAAENYQAAYLLFPFATVQKKMEVALEKIADEHFRVEQYEKAVGYYEQLIRAYPKSTFFQERLKRSRQEVAFNDMVDKGDECFFREEFEKANEWYEKALAIRKDRNVLRRKEDSARLVVKERVLRKKVEEEVHAEWDEKGRQLVESKLQEREAALREELEKEFAEKEKALRQDAEMELRPKIETEVSVRLEAKIYQELRKDFDQEEAELRKQLQEERKAFEAEKEALEKQQPEPQEAAVPAETVDAEEIREQVRSELRTELETAVRAELETELRNEYSRRESEQRQEVAKKIQAQIEKDYKEKIDHALWKSVSVLNTKDAYQCYAALMRNGKHIDEAKARMMDAAQQNRDQAPSPKQEEEPKTDEQPTLNQQAETAEAAPQPSAEAETPSPEPHQEEAPETPKAPEADQTKEQLEVLENVIREAAESGTELEEEEPSQGPAVEAQAEEEASAEPQAVSEEDEAARFSAMDEEELWEYAQKEDTRQSYMAYVEYSEDKVHIIDAYYRINQLKDGEDEQDIDSEERSVDFAEPEEAPAAEAQVEEEEEPEFAHEEDASSEEFEEQAPVAEEEEAAEAPAEAFVAEAPSEDVTPDMDEQEERLWQETQDKGTLEGYYHYLSHTRLHNYAMEAKVKINELKGNEQADENQAWDEAKRTDTVEAYQHYIAEYPLGNFYAEAMFRLNRLQKEEQMRNLKKAATV